MLVDLNQGQKDFELVKWGSQIISQPAVVNQTLRVCGKKNAWMCLCFVNVLFSICRCQNILVWKCFVHVYMIYTDVKLFRSASAHWPSNQRKVPRFHCTGFIHNLRLHSVWRILQTPICLHRFGWIHLVNVYMSFTETRINKPNISQALFVVRAAITWPNKFPASVSHDQRSVTCWLDLIENRLLFLWFWMLKQNVVTCILACWIWGTRNMYTLN